MAKIKIAQSNDNEDLVGEYLSEDPKSLSAEQLKKVADIFGLPIEDVTNIAKGMTNSRNEIREQEGEL